MREVVNIVKSIEDEVLGCVLSPLAAFSTRRTLVIIVVDEAETVRTSQSPINFQEIQIVDAWQIQDAYCCSGTYVHLLYCLTMR